MKLTIQIVMLLLCLNILNAAKAQEKYSIKCNIEGLKTDMKAFLVYNDVVKKVTISDSTLVKNGKFDFSGMIPRPSKVSLSLRPVVPGPAPKIGDVMHPQDFQSFYLTGGTTIIKARNLQSAEIRNPVQDEYLVLQKQLEPVSRQMGAVNIASYQNKNNKDSLKVYEVRKAELSTEYFRVCTEFVKKHPASYVSFDLALNNYHVISDPAGFEQMFNALAPSFKNSASGKLMEHSLNMVKKFAIGQPIMDFTQNDTNGKPVSLSSLKGKYVLVDFWASWCGPCRIEYPFLHKAYDQFRDKNFDIIGISLDDKKDLWLKSIEDNKFPWVEVCDLRGRQNEVAVAYGISAIPQSFLVDPQGIIIAKNLRGEDLIEKLKEVIK